MAGANARGEGDVAPVEGDAPPGDSRIGIGCERVQGTLVRGVREKEKREKERK